MLTPNKQQNPAPGARRFQPSRPGLGRKSRAIKARSVLIGILVLGLAGFALSRLQIGKTISSVGDAVGDAANKVVPVVKKDNSAQIEAMRQSVQAIIDANPHLTIGVAVSDLEYGTKATVGSPEPMLGASTTKLLTAAVFLTGVEKGTYSLDQKYGGYPASWHLQQMINQSNNSSWETLIAAVTYKQLGVYAANIGMTGYNYYDNSLTAADEAVLIQKLYKGELLNREHTDLVLSHMQNTNNELLIPPAVAADVTVYHKYGQYLGHYHDAGVLIKDNHPVVVVIYTKSADGSYAGRVEVIQQITRAITSSLFVPAT